MTDELFRVPQADELHDLDNLVKHPGWQRFAEQGRKEIEARLNTALQNAANNTDDTLAINQVRQCIAVKQAVEALMAWPSQRVTVLRRADERGQLTSVGFSRRGDL